MLAGIIKDIKNNIIYNIYFKNYKNKIDINVKCIDNEKYYYLNQKEVINLLSIIFNYSKKEYGTYKSYKIFLDDANNKHFIKNNIENIELFYLNNGQNPIMYNIFNKNDKNVPKLFEIRNTKKDIAYILITSLICLNAFYIGFNFTDLLNDNITINEVLTKDIAQFYNYINILDTQEITNKIYESTGLSQEEKDYLINENLFNDILNVSNRGRNQILREKTSNIKKVFFTEEELITKEKSGGFYNPLEPNIIHVRNEENDTKSIMIHEFIHLLQEDNQYYFIREAVAEIIKEEYYGVKINAYQEEIKYVKILMEIIGPKPVFECCFKGDISSFENSIKKLLNDKDSKELLNLFTTRPLYCENKEEVYQKIKILYTKMCNKNIFAEEPIVISTLIYPEYINRGYFNKKYIEECNNKDSYLYETLRVEDVVNKGFIEIKCSVVKIDKLTIDEFLLSGGDARNINYSSLPDYYYNKKNVINSKTKEKYTLKEAIEKGVIYDVDFFKYTIIENLTLDEVIKYVNIEGYYGDIKIVDADYDNVKHVEIPYFTNNKDEGKIPLVKIVIKKKIESIINKFPDQFIEENNYNIKK